MPVDPKNKKLYLENWAEISKNHIEYIAGMKCEICKVDNFAFVIRSKLNGVPVYQYEDGNVFSAVDGSFICDRYIGDFTANVSTVHIVLCVLHLDNNPDNNNMANLRALCQKCLSNHVSKHRLETSRLSKEKKTNQINIFTDGL